MSNAANMINKNGTGKDKEKILQEILQILALADIAKLKEIKFFIESYCN